MLPYTSLCYQHVHPSQSIPRGCTEQATASKHNQCLPPWRGAAAAAVMESCESITHQHGQGCRRRTLLECATLPSQNITIMLLVML